MNAIVQPFVAVLADIGLLAAVCAFGGVILSSLVQRLTGQGFGLIAAPVLAFVAPEYLPTTLLFLGFFVGLGSAALAADAVDLREVPPGLAGRAVGAALAAWVAAAVAGSPLLPLIVALIVYLAIALSVAGLRVAIRPMSLFLGQIVSGLMGTLTAIGGPPMALLYQHEPPRRSAAMQNLFFMTGMVISFIALSVAGLIEMRHILLALMLAPAAALGVMAAQPLAPRIERGKMRPITLVLAGCAATALLLRYFT